MSVFALGLKCLKRFCEEQSPIHWYKAKLIAGMFKAPEVPVFEWVAKFVKDFHQLPQIATLVKKFPEMDSIQCVEPAAYYLKHIETRYFYEKINAANLASQEVLKANPEDIDGATKFMRDAMQDISKQKFRARIVDVALDGPPMLMTAYHSTLLVENVAEFGWPYLDDLTGGLMGGDIVSFIGRPAAGKTFKVLRTAIHNWRKGRNVLFVSMEMAPLPIIQRIAAMYGHTNLTQLKMGGYSTLGGKESTYSKFLQGLAGLAHEKAKFYVVDGNLAASAEDVYELAVQLGADIVLVDGAYLMKHRNNRLDKFTRVAENCELMKTLTSDLEIPTFASWQFNREASKKKDAKQHGGLEDIAFSDAIGQISTVVLGLFQEDSVETLYQRLIKVLKGRNGEIGEFMIHWDFMKMNFDQVVDPSTIPEPPELEFL